VKTEWGFDGESEQINWVRARVLDRSGSGVGQKWLLEKLNTRVFLVMQSD